MRILRVLFNTMLYPLIICASIGAALGFILSAAVAWDGFQFLSPLKRGELGAILGGALGMGCGGYAGMWRAWRYNVICKQNVGGAKAAEAQTGT